MGEAGKHFVVCDRIMHARPRWIVVWGPVSGFYYAFPRFGIPDWLLAVFDPDPNGLIARIDEVEKTLGIQRPGRGGG
jgi:hypothetical protein